MISRPKTPVEFARNLKFILDHDLLLQDEFYTEANLKDIFNLEEVDVFKDNRWQRGSSDFRFVEPFFVNIPVGADSGTY